MHAAFTVGPLDYTQNTLKEDALSICSPPSAFFQAHLISTVLTSVSVESLLISKLVLVVFLACFGC